MSADILTASGAPVTLGPPAPDEQGKPSVFLGYVPTGDQIITLTASGYDANPQDVGYQSANEITATGYNLDGSVAFRTILFDTYTVQGPPIGLSGPVMVQLPTGWVAVAWNNTFYSSQAGSSNNHYAIVTPSGTVTSSAYVNSAGGAEFPVEGDPALYGTAAGFTMAWNAETSPINAPQYRAYAYQTQAFDQSGVPAAGTSTPEGSFGGYNAPDLGVHALAPSQWGPLQLSDNTVQFYNHIGTIPGEPAHAITSEAAALLADGVAAVAWVDSGTDYVSIFNASTDSFGPTIGLDWGGASDVHVVSLNDGGFAVSWMNGGAYRGEVFDGAGNGGGIISLAGDVAGIDIQGQLYTVGRDSSGDYVVQTYAINGAGGGGTTGQTFNSDNNGDTWVGTAGNDTFNLGRGGDVVTGNGGNDTYNFAGIPWAGGRITDFNAGDVLDLTGLMSTTSDTGTDGFADGYLKIASDSAGNAQIWANYNIPGNDGWWLVETLNRVSASSLAHTGDVITVGSSSGGGGGGGTSGPTAVSTSDATYTAPSTVNSITLTGSQQTVTANNAQDTAIWSNNTGNALNGGTGDDTLHIGRGGDWVTGGAGRDVFAFGDIPWAAATINDLDPNQGDSIDVSGILAKAGYTGSDPIGDGYLKIINGAPNNDQVWANYNLPGNSAWWLVATVHDNGGSLPLGPLQYDGAGVIAQQGEHVGGTITIPNNPPGNVSVAGYDTIVLNNSNYTLKANDGGDTLGDLGSQNQLLGEEGNDTFVLGTSTTEATDSWGGVDTWQLNPESIVVTHSYDALTAGDRLDVRVLLAAAHYTGSNPVGDGYVFMVAGPPPAPGQMGPTAASQLFYDPDGAAGSESARPLFDTYYTTPSQFHYADGFFVVQ